MIRFLKSIDYEGPKSASLALLILRVGISSLMLTHGWGKLANYAEMSTQFGDPIGLGPATSLTLTVFAEFFCSIALILGLFTRAALIPLMTTMLVAVIIVHADDPFRRQETGLLYLVPYLTLLLTGPGKFSLDNLIYRRFSRS